MAMGHLKGALLGLGAVIVALVVALATTTPKLEHIESFNVTVDRGVKKN